MLTGPSPGSFTNAFAVGSITGDGGTSTNSQPSSASLTVISTVPISGTIAFSSQATGQPTAKVVGLDTVYEEITLTNQNSTVLTGVRFSNFALPPLTQVVGPIVNSCGGVLTQGGGAGSSTLTLTGASIPADPTNPVQGGNCKIRIPIQVIDPTQYTSFPSGGNFAQNAIGSDLGVGSQAITGSVWVQAGMLVLKGTPYGGTVGSGSTGVFSIEVRNLNLDPINVNFTDVMPQGADGQPAGVYIENVGGTNSPQPTCTLGNGAVDTAARACYELTLVASQGKALGNMSRTKTRKCKPASTCGSRS